MNPISYEEAVQIANRFATEIYDRYDDKILAVYAIGSLGSDYYRPGQSDIDTVVITSYARKDVGQITEEIEQIADWYWKNYHVPKGFGAIVFAEEQLYPPYQKTEELVLEIMRLKMQSRPILGSYEIDKIPMPDKTAIIEDAISFEEWAASERRRDPSFKVSTQQMLVNSTLMALKRYLMIQCNVVEFNKFKVIATYMLNDPPIVEATLFDYVDKSLSDQLPVEIEKDTALFAQLVEAHGRIYEHINLLTLGFSKL